MNVSMHNSESTESVGNSIEILLTELHPAYNLGWKLASVLKHRSHRSLLKTYETERRKIAQDLIDFDHKFSRLFFGRPSKDLLDTEGIDLKQFKQVFEKGNLFANGTAVDYNGSIIVAKEASAAQGTETAEKGTSDFRAVAKQQLATGISIGKRMPSFKVLNQSDARPWHL
jgi:phenol 2-monooxygenase (NADPH)